MIFKEIQWKNLFSYGKGITKVKLDTNQTVNIIGKNGEGKSVFVEAVYFALTGKPLRKCKVEQIVNTTNKKNAWVKLKIESGNRLFEIERGTKPKVFSIKIDGKTLDEDSEILITQDHLELLLGYKRTNLKHTLIMSTTDYTPFLRLIAADKRAFIEDILAIEIFTVMNKIVKAKLSILKEEMQDIHREIEQLEYKIDMIRDYNKEQNTTNELMLDEVREKMDRDKGLIDELETKLSALKKKEIHFHEKAEGIKQNAEVIELKIKEREGIKDQQQQKYRTGRSKGDNLLTQIHTQISVKNKDLDFFEGNDICPKCKQPLEGQGIDDCLDELKAEIADLEKRQGKVRDELKKVEKLGAKIDQYEAEKIKPLKNNIADLQTDMHQAIRESDNTKHSIGSSKDKIGIYNQNIVDFEKQVETMLAETKGKLKDEAPVQKDLDANQEQANKLVFDDLVHRTTIKILSDKGIKTYIINKYIPVLNKLVNKYLQILSAPYQLVFDSELNEKIALKGYEKLSYNNFSEGERQRCDIALLFAFLDIAKMKNSLTSNLLIMDEVFDRSLDDDGIRGILNIVDSMKDKGFTVFNISHKHQLKDKFDVTYQVTKDQFSHLELMSD
jgi:DNA repair exonuclease SbcCD ATPase subunit